MQLMLRCSFFLLILRWTDARISFPSIHSNDSKISSTRSLEIDDIMADLPPPPGAFPGGFAGLFPGLQKSLNLDVNAGIGGGIPGYGGLGGLGGPYLPVTPMGALAGIKGDLLVPIVVVGVALFILLIIVLTVKAVLTWKVGLLRDLTSPKVRFNRSEGAEPMSEDAMTEMTAVVWDALQSNCWDNKLLCGMGKMMKKRTEYLSVFKIILSLLPDSMVPTMNLMMESAERTESCEVLFPCHEIHNNTMSSNTEEHSKFPNSTMSWKTEHNNTI